MNKAYTRINWQNAPSEATALNETNLNKMDSAIDTIDDRVIAHDTRLENAEYAIGQDEDNITDLQNGKVDKEEGKGISTLQDIEVIPVTRKGTFVGSIRTQDQSGDWTTKDFYNQTEVDTSLSQSSKNPLENRVIWYQLSNKADKSTVNTALAGKVDKVTGKGLFNFSNMQFYDDTTMVGEVIAHIIMHSQNPDPLEPDMEFDIYNGIEPITNEEIDALA